MQAFAFLSALFAALALAWTHKGPVSEVKDWSTVRMSLARTDCLGTCPVYQVEIDGYRNVTYNGQAYVAVLGEHRATISREALEQLLAGFRATQFFALRQRFEANMEDLPSQILSLSIDGKMHSVVDGSGLGVPKALRALEDEFDRIAQTDKWVRGNRHTIPQLREEGFDFRSDTAGKLLAAVARSGDVALVNALIREGAPRNIRRTEFYWGAFVAIP